MAAYTLDLPSSIGLFGVCAIIILYIVYRRYRNSVTFRIIAMILGVAGLTYLAAIAFMRIDPNSTIYMPVVFIGSLVGIVGLVIIAQFLFKTVVFPLKNVSVASQRIATGDLSFEVSEYPKHDEIGDLSRAFIQLMNFLKPTVQEILAFSENLAASANQMAWSAEGLNTSSEEITSIAQQLASGAARQTEQIDASVTKAEELQRQFEEKIHGIESTSELLANISNQVNILALNASIEAARAGDYGRGFAVVADNVRRLATESKQSLDQVNQTISDLRTSLADAIGEITSSIGYVASISEETAASSEEASAATEQQTATIQELTASAQQISSMAADLDTIVKRFRT